MPRVSRNYQRKDFGDLLNELHKEDETVAVDETSVDITSMEEGIVISCFR